MNPRLLHSVIDKVLTAIEQYPELREEALRFVFDERNCIRVALTDFEDADPRFPAALRTQDGRGAVCFAMGRDVLASDDLIQFAHAVANGVVPDMPLRLGAATG